MIQVKEELSAHLNVAEFIYNSDAIENIYNAPKEYTIKHEEALLLLCKSPTEDNLIQAHKLLMPHILDKAYRTVEVMINESAWKPAKYVPQHMNELFNIPVRSALDACDWHIKYEHIHPFKDGNGRTGRMLLAAHLLSVYRNIGEMGPVIIPAVEKYYYYDCIAYNLPAEFLAHLRRWRGVEHKE